MHPPAHAHAHAHTHARAFSRSCAHAHAHAHARSRSLATLLLLAPALWLASCTTPPITELNPNTNTAPATDSTAATQAQLAAAPKKDKALWQYRLAATALHHDRPDIAKPALDAALATAAANYGAPNPAAAKSRLPRQYESDKPFIGEPYERIMANYYRALLYWADGDLENARALLRNAQLIDSDINNKTRASYFILLDYLEGILAAKLTSSTPNSPGTHDAAGAAAFARARANAAAQHRPRLPDCDPAANVFLFVDYGDGPLKRPGGDDGEKLAYYLPGYPCSFAKLTINDRTINLPPYDDIGLQAIICDGRLMDKILAEKNSRKKPYQSVGNAFVKAGVSVAKSEIPESDKDNIGSAMRDSAMKYGLAAVLLLASAPFHTAASNITQTAQADTRCWNNLPRYLSFAALKLPPGTHEAELNFYDPLGRLYFPLTQHLTITVPDPAALPPGARPKDTVIIRSQLRN